MKTMRIMFSALAVMLLVSVGVVVTSENAYAGTLRWTYASCSGKGSVGVGWQANGSLRRPAMVYFSTRQKVTRLNVAYNVGATRRGSASFPENTTRDAHNWRNLRWYNPKGMRVLFNLVGPNCSANVTP